MELEANVYTISQLPELGFMFSNSHDAVDRKILEIVAELSSRLNHRVNPRTLVWNTRQRLDECRFNGSLRAETILVSSKLKGRLEAREWEALIASSLIANRLEQNLMRKVAVFALLLMAGGIGLPLIFRDRGPLVLDTLVLLYIPAALLAIIALVLTATRRSKLKSDIEAASLLESHLLLSVLQKISRINEEKSQDHTIRQGKLRKWLSDLPSLDERIRNLESIVPR